MTSPLAASLILGRMTYLEARRNRIILTVLVFAVVIVALSFVFQEVTTTALDRIVRDVALAAIHAFGLILAVYLGVSVVSKEIERRTVYMLVSKSVSRGSYVVGKVLGVAGTLAVVLGLMVVVFVAQQWLFSAPLVPILFQACWLLYVQLLVVATFAVFASTFSSPLMASFMAVGLFAVGELSPELYLLAQQTDLPAYAAVLKVLYFLLPALDRLNLKTEASVLQEVSGVDVLLATAHGLLFAAVFVSGAVVVFARRDLK